MPVISICGGYGRLQYLPTSQIKQLQTALSLGTQFNLNLDINNMYSFEYLYNMFVSSSAMSYLYAM